MDYLNRIAFVQWDITGICNLDCAFCRQFQTRSLSGQLNLRDFESVIDQFPEMKVEHLSIAGGEPLLFPDLLELIRYAKKHVDQVSLLTNATLINDRFAKVFAENLRYVQVSVDGIGDAHDKIRGGGTFAKTTEGIRKLKRAGMRVFVRITVFRDNVDQVISLMKWCKENGIDSFVCRRVIPSGNGDKVSLLSPGELRKILLVVESTGKELGLRVEYGDPFPDLLIRQERRQEADKDISVLKGLSVGGCSVGIDAMYITQNGYVCLCPYLPIFCGDVKTQKIKKIWIESETYKKIRSVRYNLTGKCGQCKYRFACGGCRAVAYFNTGNICGEDDGCWH